ncbi:MAG: YggS family pyridoxal phosphate-dependent enzyme [Elusimicrobiaceae bacterium]|nr:YggS family pyridoxal phosphate-dependent enzyme [Elusimicrobiaceae bacterium]
MNAAEKVTQNLLQVQTAIKTACQVSGQTQANVHLLAVTKYANDEDVLALLETGQIAHIGESRVQQAVIRWKNPTFAKYPVYKHFIGHLQKNKTAQAAELFDFIDSIDDISTAQALNRQAEKLGKRLFVMLQIKLTQRETQSGISLQEAPQLLSQIRELAYLIPCGYMAIAPQTENVQELRPLFKQVKMAFDRDFPLTLQHRYLSLGMSNDFKTAVEEGSTLPRIGSMLFAEHREEV